MRRHNSKLALSQYERRHRYLQEEKSETETETGTRAPIINYNDKIVVHGKPKDYGTAYENNYEGGFYYGDIETSDGSLPNCFPEDIEC